MKKSDDHKSIFSIPLVREITIVLILKLVVIFSIKAMFFSSPVDLKESETSVESHFGLLAKPTNKNESNSD